MKSVLILGLILSLYSCDNNRKSGARIEDPNIVDDAFATYEPETTEEFTGKLSCSAGMATALENMVTLKKNIHNSLYEMKSTYELILASESPMQRAHMDGYKRDENSYVTSIVDLSTLCGNILKFDQEHELEEGCLIGNEVHNISSVQAICNNDAQFALSETMRVQLNEMGLFTKIETVSETTESTPVAELEVEDAPENETEVTEDEVIRKEEIKVEERICSEDLAKTYSQADMVRSLINSASDKINVDLANAVNEELPISSRIQARNNAQQQWTLAFGENSSLDLQNPEGLLKKLVNTCLSLDELIATEHPCWLNRERAKHIVNAASFEETCQFETANILSLNTAQQTLKEIELIEEKKEEEAEVVITEEKNEKTPVKEETAKKEEKIETPKEEPAKEEKAVETKPVEAKPVEDKKPTEKPAEINISESVNGKCSSDQIIWLAQTHDSAWRIFDNYGVLKTAYDNMKTSQYAQTKEKEIRNFAEFYSSVIVPVKAQAETLCLKAAEYKKCEGTFRYNRHFGKKAQFNVEHSTPTEEAVAKTCSSLKAHMTNINIMVKNIEKQKMKIKSQREKLENKPVVENKKDETETEKKETKPVVEEKEEKIVQEDELKERPACTPEINFSIEEIETRREEVLATLATVEGEVSRLENLKETVAIEKHKSILKKYIEDFKRNIKELGQTCESFKALTKGMDSCGDANEILKFTDILSVREKSCQTTDLEKRIEQIKKNQKI